MRVFVEDPSLNTGMPVQGGAFVSRNHTVLRWLNAM
jgi:hypothetical protein